MMGTHLVEFYAKQNIIPIATHYKPTANIGEVKSLAVWLECDVRYFQHLHSIISKYKPTIIYHLAAQSFPTVSWERAAETMDINVGGTVNLLESIKLLKQEDENYNPKVVIACSSAQYGSSLTPENVPITEDKPMLPLHPYGVSKVTQDLLGYQYFMNYGIRTIRARIFNTTGVRKINDAASEFTRRAVLIKKGKLDKFPVGNLTAQRAITDVRDLIQALDLLARKGKDGEAYNVCGDKIYLMSDIIEYIKKIVGIDFETYQDPSLMRPMDEPVIVGSSEKLLKDTGWKQSIDIETTLRDMIDYWNLTL